jgi:hypothetical protein
MGTGDRPKLALLSWLLANHADTTGHLLAVQPEAPDTGLVE